VARAPSPAKANREKKTGITYSRVDQFDLLDRVALSCCDKGPGMTFVPETNFLIQKIHFLTLHFFCWVYNRP
jgi:hypothetical protein